MLIVNASVSFREMKSFQSGSNLYGLKRFFFVCLFVFFNYLQYHLKMNQHKRHSIT